MINIKSLKKKFGHAHVIREFSYEFKENKVTCLCGPSGCGKTTLLNILSGVADDYEGENGFKGRHIAYVFQEDRLIPWHTVLENIEFVLEDKNRLNDAKKFVDMVELNENINKYPFELSGGMKRRVALARGLAYSSDILIMDEPFKGLDEVLKYKIIKRFIDHWTSNDMTVVVVTHDIEEAKLFCDEIVYLDGSPLKVLKVEKNERKID